MQEAVPRGEVPAVARPFWKGFLLHLHEALATCGEEGNPDTWKRAIVLGAYLNLGPTDPIELSSAPTSIFTVSLMVRLAFSSLSLSHSFLFAFLSLSLLRQNLCLRNHTHKEITAVGFSFTG